MFIFYIFWVFGYALTDAMKLGVLYEIISKLEGQELTVRHPSDGTI